MRQPGSSPAIGVFDSGVGGLTVVRRILDRLPTEPVVYLGDTARVPYGTKSEDTVIRYAQACAGILLERDIKLLVVACNTASAYALDALRDTLDVPVLGVIAPGAQYALRTTKNGRIGVIGTEVTIASGSYLAALHAIEPRVEVFCKACPLFVPLAEEGWTEGDVPQRVAREYLSGLAARGVDTLVLGCTHYPLLKTTIAGAMGPGVTLVDSAEATSATVAAVLADLDMACAGGPVPQHRFLVSDAPETFMRVGRRFLGRDIDNVEWVDF